MTAGMRPAILFSMFGLAMLIGLNMPVRAQTEDILPPAVRARIKTPLDEVGSGTYRRFGFSVYRASLWAPEGEWNAGKPYALALRYTRSVSKETLVDTVTDNIRDQKVTDEATLARWNAVLNDTLPAVEDGDTIVGLCLPGKPSMLFYNGVKVASIDDPTFSKAFFDIWLGAGADENLRAKLIGRTQ